MRSLIALLALFELASGFSPISLPGNNGRLSSTAIQGSSGSVATMPIVDVARIYLDESEVDLEQSNLLVKLLELEAHGIEARLEEFQLLAQGLSERPRVSSLDFQDRQKNDIATPAVLNEMDTMCLMNVATLCGGRFSNEYCSPDDQVALVNRLEEQSVAWNYRLAEVLSLMKRLKDQESSADSLPDSSDIEALTESIHAALTMEYHHITKVPTSSLQQS